MKNPSTVISGRRVHWTVFWSFPITIAGTLLLIFVVSGWWQSSRYSERRLLYFGTKSAEVFTSSSLIRLSVVDGYIDPHGRPRGYRQRNARGRMMIRPLVPSVRFAPSIWELTIGFWHVAALALVVTVVAAWFEARGFQARLRKP